MFPTIHGVASQGGTAGEPPAATRGGPAIYNETGWQSATLSDNLGWQFQVGANDITITHLRYYNASAQTETVRLYRASDTTLLASAAVTTTGGWAEEEITPITLAAGQSYVISHRAGGSSRTVRRNPTSYQLDPAVTRTGGVFGTTDAMPTSSSAQNYAAASFRTQGPSSGYRFYRWNVTANNGRSTINVAEAQLRETVGGADAATGGLPYATSVFSGSFPASAAFDDDAGTYWATATSTTAAELWYDRGTAREISVAQYAIQARADANDGTPKDWTFQASNDLDTWTTLDTVMGATGWSNGETRTYTV